MSRYCCHLSIICLLSDNILPSLSLRTNVFIVGGLDKFLTSLFIPLIFPSIPSFFFLLQVLLVFLLFSQYISKFVLVFLFKRFPLASFFSRIALLHSSSHQWLAFFASLDDLNFLAASNITFSRFCQSWLMSVSSSISCSFDCISS